MFVAGKFLVNSLRSCAKTIGVTVVAFIGQALSAIARSCNNQVPASVYAAVIAEEAQQFVRERQGALDIKVRSGSGPHAIGLESDESSELCATRPIVWIVLEELCERLPGTGKRQVKAEY